MRHPVRLMLKFLTLNDQFGGVIGVCPTLFGSFKRSKASGANDPPYFVWGDIAFQRIKPPKKGHFMAEITIQNLKDNKKRNTYGTRTSEQLPFQISS